MSGPTTGDVHVNVPLGPKGKKPRTQLKNLLVKEVSFCGTPANQHANITLYKSLEGADNVTIDELKKQLETALAEKAELAKAKTEVETELAKSLADLKNAKKVPPKAQADGGKDDPDADDMKKAISAEIAKAVEVLQKQNDELVKTNKENEVKLAKEIAHRELSELTKRAVTELPNLVGTPEVKAQLLKSVEALGEDAVKVLKAADAAMAKNFTELGSSKAIAKSGGEAQLEAMAHELAKTNKITFAKAYSTVLSTTEGRKIYAEMNEKK